VLHKPSDPTCKENFQVLIKAMDSLHP